jgi:hypothetical protein
MSNYVDNTYDEEEIVFCPIVEIDTSILMRRCSDSVTDPRKRRKRKFIGIIACFVSRSEHLPCYEQL